MKDNVLVFIVCVLLAILCCAVLKLANIIIVDAVTSSPVEEMYHRQLVVTLDSILDARFGAGCCEEDIDTVNTNTFHTKFSDMISPMD